MSEDNSITEQEELAIENFNMGAVEDLIEEKSNEVAETPAPSPGDAEWNDYVMSQFTIGETDDNGHPFVHGLRRVSTKLLGPTIKSECKLVLPPEDCLGLRPTVCEYSITLLKEHKGISYEVVYTDVGDVNYLNTEEAFLRFASATASTRGEARCYRKALMLRKCAADELPKNIPDIDTDGNIDKQQLQFIDVLASRIDIDVIKFINMGKGKYKSYLEIPYSKAASMIKVLSEFQRKKETIPQDIKGYKKGWRE